MAHSTFQPLSGSSKGGLISALAVEAGDPPTATLLHAVPDGETHRVNIVMNNTHASAAVRVVGHLLDGAADQTYVIDVEPASRLTAKLLDDHILDGPCTVRASAIANGTSARITGSVEVIRRA